MTLEETNKRTWEILNKIIEEKPNTTFCQVCGKIISHVMWTWEPIECDHNKNYCTKNRGVL
jgi:hypothetical protein